MGEYYGRRFILKAHTSRYGARVWNFQISTWLIGEHYIDRLSRLRQKGYGETRRSLALAIPVGSTSLASPELQRSDDGDGGRESANVDCASAM